MAVLYILEVIDPSGYVGLINLLVLFLLPLVLGLTGIRSEVRASGGKVLESVNLVGNSWAPKQR